MGMISDDQGKKGLLDVAFAMVAAERGEWGGSASGIALGRAPVGSVHQPEVKGVVSPDVAEERGSVAVARGM
jgi:hypothetical protein